MHDRALLDATARLQREGTSYCVVTIVDARGSIPQEIGASALFGPQGLMFGTVGGGRLEVRCAEQARLMLTAAGAPRTRFERLSLHRDLGMSCAGEVALYYEAHHLADAWNVVVFGAGHVAQKLTRFLVEFDCRVVCVDTRDEWLARLPTCDRLEARKVARFTDGVEAVREGSDVIVMTMGHVTDIPILEALARSRERPGFVGVIGSKAKAAIVRRQLLKLGVERAFVDGIVCPVGDRLGGNTPPEIAAGVLSQLVRQRRGRARADGDEQRGQDRGQEEGQAGDHVGDKEARQGARQEAREGALLPAAALRRA